MVIAPARRAGDPRSNPGPGENFLSYIIELNDWFVFCCFASCGRLVDPFNTIKYYFVIMDSQ